MPENWTRTNHHSVLLRFELSPCDIPTQARVVSSEALHPGVLGTAMSPLLSTAGEGFESFAFNKLQREAQAASHGLELM